MREIRIGLEERLDVSFYQNPLFQWQQMKEIRLGLESGISVNKYALIGKSSADMRRLRLEYSDSEPEIEYTEEQMREIVMGLEAGIDVSVYSSPSLPAAMMHSMRKELAQQLSKPGKEGLVE